jgi:hypothetical protein
MVCLKAFSSTRIFSGIYTVFASPDSKNSGEQTKKIDSNIKIFTDLPPFYYYPNTMIVHDTVGKYSDFHAFSSHETIIS